MSPKTSDSNVRVFMVLQIHREWTYSTIRRQRLQPIPNMPLITCRIGSCNERGWAPVAPSPTHCGQKRRIRVYPDSQSLWSPSGPMAVIEGVISCLRP
jgi:hypothetical protein